MTKTDYLNTCLQKVEFTIEREDENGVWVSSFRFPNATATGRTRDEAVDNLKEKIYEVDPIARIFFS